MIQSNSYGDKMSKFLRKAGEVTKKVASSLDQLSTSFLNKSNSFNESLNNSELIPNSSSRNDNFEQKIPKTQDFNSNVSLLFYSFYI